MCYKLFLDDERYPRTIYNTRCHTEIFSSDDDWVIARSYNVAVDIVTTNGCPQFISFDHDLGTGKTGMDFAKWIIEQALNDSDFIPVGFDYYVHSMNPVGAENIWLLLINFFNRR